MIVSQLAFVALGVLLLAAGAEGLVRGGARLAGAFRVSPLVIGLTVVAFGTSMPEFVVSTLASYNGQSDIAMGNVVGSNIFNILGILGLAALITPLTVQAAVVRREVPIMIGVSVVLFIVAVDGTIGRSEGALLFFGIVAYTVFSYRTSRRETAAVVEQFESAVPAPVAGRVERDILYVIGGLVLLVVGARVLVDAAIPLAKAMGISERVIALTLVAIGTSMPELATSIVAALRRQTDIAVGNIVGSNIFNILCILGTSSMIRPLTVSTSMLYFDIPVMLVAAIATFPVVYSQRRISRTEGAFFAAAFVVYTVVVILSGSPAEAAIASDM